MCVNIILFVRNDDFALIFWFNYGGPMGINNKWAHRQLWQEFRVPAWMTIQQILRRRFRPDR